MAQALRPLHVGLIVKHTPVAYERDNRNMGLFSYAVPEFTWEHIQVQKHGTLNTADYAKRFDLLFEEDGGNWPNYIGHALPIVYYAIDSTLSYDNHYLPRYQQSKKADLCLVDHDQLERFGYRNRPVRRLSYCVNDKLFYDRGLERDIDVNFHCGGGNEGRAEVRRLLAAYCHEHGLKYVSGTVELGIYAEHMARSKVVVVVPRVDGNRPHRILDAMASGACVITGKIPMSDEKWCIGDDLLMSYDNEGIIYRLDHAFTDDEYDMYWLGIAPYGHKLIQETHTWSVRSKELRQMIDEVLHV